MATPQVFKLGNTTILVQSNAFEDGYWNGFVSCPKDVVLPTDGAISEFLVSNLFDDHATPLWNAGYLVGAIRGLLVGRADSTESELSQVQFSTLTLHLDNERFREGFFTGQHDYRLFQGEGGKMFSLKASDLLRFIALYDPETERYSFGKDELRALEDTLGQLVGYLCAALFPQQEPRTRPIEQAAILQEA